MSISHKLEPNGLIWKTSLTMMKCRCLLFFVINFPKYLMKYFKSYLITWFIFLLTGWYSYNLKIMCTVSKEPFLVLFILLYFVLIYYGYGNSSIQITRKSKIVIHDRVFVNAWVWYIFKRILYYVWYVGQLDTSLIFNTSLLQ